MWIEDPKTKEKSVTLTITIITLVIVIVGAIMEYLGKGKSPEAAVDLFWGSLAAYVGRRFTFKGKDFNGS